MSFITVCAFSFFQGREEFSPFWKQCIELVLFYWMLSNCSFSLENFLRDILWGLLLLLSFRLGKMTKKRSIQSLLNKTDSLVTLQLHADAVNDVIHRVFQRVISLIVFNVETKHLSGTYYFMLIYKPSKYNPVNNATDLFPKFWRWCLLLIMSLYMLN